MVLFRLLFFFQNKRYLLKNSLRMSNSLDPAQADGLGTSYLQIVSADTTASVRTLEQMPFSNCVASESLNPLKPNGLAHPYQ